jgi:L-cystine uptake protein TcyP (sodium:dicarboxylate symporter family)
VTGSRQYLRFLGFAVGLVVALCAVGYVPTRRLSGENGVAAMAAGCGISLVSAAMAGLLLTAVAAQTPEARMQRGFLAMVVRLAVVTVLGVAAVLSGAFARTPLLFWMATAYLVLLPLEVKLAIASE